MRWTERRLAALLAIAVMLGYSAVASSVRSFYPFSVFPMYSASPIDRSVARIVARTAGGDATEVTAYRAFACDRELDVDRIAAECGAAFAPQYVDDALATHVRARSGELPDGSGEEIEIVRRLWTLDEQGAFTVSDCVLARCSAVRDEAARDEAAR